MFAMAVVKTELQRGAEVEDLRLREGEDREENRRMSRTVETAPSAAAAAGVLMGKGIKKWKPAN